MRQERREEKGDKTGVFSWDRAKQATKVISSYYQASRERCVNGGGKLEKLLSAASKDADWSSHSTTSWNHSDQRFTRWSCKISDLKSLHSGRLSRPHVELGFHQVFFLSTNWICALIQVDKPSTFEQFWNIEEKKGHFVGRWKKDEKSCSVDKKVNANKSSGNR